MRRQPLFDCSFERSLPDCRMECTRSTRRCRRALLSVKRTAPSKLATRCRRLQCPRNSFVHSTSSTSRRQCRRQRPERCTIEAALRRRRRAAACRASRARRPGRSRSSTSRSSARPRSSRIRRAVRTPSGGRTATRFRRRRSSSSSLRRASRR